MIIGGNKHVNTWIGKIGVGKGLQQVGYGCNYVFINYTVYLKKGHYGLTFWCLMCKVYDMC